MPNIHNILGAGTMIDSVDRAVDAWKRIQDKPTSVTLKRLGTAQTVRLEYDNTVAEETGAGGKSSRRKLIIFGIRDHITLPDTDIQSDDRFSVEGIQFKVIDLVFTLGEIQATAEAMT